MAIGTKQIIAIAVVAVVAIAAVGVAWYILNKDKNDGGYTLVIEPGNTITEAQLDDLKNKAASNDKIYLEYDLTNYKVVFDSKAIQSIESVADLSVAAVDKATLAEGPKYLLGENGSVIDINYGDNTAFGEGSVKVTMPYVLPEGTTADELVLSYINGENKPVNVPFTYADGKITFSTNHFSKFAATTVTPATSAELMVFGNADGNTTIDADDVTELNKIIGYGVTAQLAPIADANQDGLVNNDDVALVNKMINRESAVIWHYSMHDVDDDGHMDKKIVSTKFPVTSAIMTGSSNTFMMFYCLGIIDEIKGASYGSSNDKILFGDNYLSWDKDLSDAENLAAGKVVKFDSSSQSITLEDGQHGASNVISLASVTCCFSDWNRTYLTNEAAFETANVDVVRISAAATKHADYAHSIALLGLLFNKVERAQDLIALYDTTYGQLNEALEALDESQIKKAVASSMAGYLSSDGSDYTDTVLSAGTIFGLEGFNFNGTTSVKISDNMSVFDTRKYQFDNIVHIRTALGYDTKTDVKAQWTDYANSMLDWEHAYDGQVMVSGVIPIPLRAAYIACAIYGDSCPTLTKDWADALHTEFLDFYETEKKASIDLSKCTFYLPGYRFTLTYNNEDVTVKNANNEDIPSGTTLDYGTVFTITPVVEKSGFVIRADGATYVEKDSNYRLTNDTKVKYVDPVIAQQLSDAAAAFAANYDGVYGDYSSEDEVASATVTFPSGSKYVRKVVYSYEQDADAAYTALKTSYESTVSSKSYDMTVLDVSGYAGIFDKVLVAYRTSDSNSNGGYSTTYLYFMAYSGNIVIDGSSTTQYYVAAKGTYGSNADAKAFADAIATAFAPAPAPAA